WIMDLATQHSVRVGGGQETGSEALWSPDGRSLAFIGGEGEKSGLMVATANGTGGTLIAPVTGSNSPLPEQGKRITWSPDSKQIAFVSATPGPEPPITGDPVVITRYLYKPDYSEGNSHFNDNRRLHIFLADLASKHVRQLTQGTRETGRRMAKKSFSSRTTSP